MPTVDGARVPHQLGEISQCLVGYNRDTSHTLRTKRVSKTTMADQANILEKLAQLNPRRLSHDVSLSVHVSDQLETLLDSGAVGIGQKLPTESELCEVFGVSRTVIREAITQLKSLGLVETRRGVGTTIIRTTPVEAMPAKTVSLETVEDILHVLELRLSVEPAAAELAAQRHDSHDRRILLEKHAAFIRARFEQPKAREEDYSFHCAIAAATKNPIFKQFYEHLSQNMIPRSNLMHDELDASKADNYLARVEQEHARILEAILGRDCTTAREMMYQHMARASITYKKYYDATGKRESVST